MQKRRNFVVKCGYPGGFANFLSTVDGEKVRIFRKKQDVLNFLDYE